MASATITSIGFGLDLTEMIRVEFLDPVAALGIVDNEELRPVGQEAKQRLERVAQRLAEL